MNRSDGGIDKINDQAKRLVRSFDKKVRTTNLSEPCIARRLHRKKDVVLAMQA